MVLTFFLLLGYDFFPDGLFLFICTWKCLRTEIKCYLIKLSSIYHSDNLFLEISENILNIGCYENFHEVFYKQLRSLIFDCLKNCS